MVELRRMFDPTPLIYAGIPATVMFGVLDVGAPGFHLIQPMSPSSMRILHTCLFSCLFDYKLRLLDQNEYGGVAAYSA